MSNDKQPIYISNNDLLFEYDPDDYPDVPEAFLYDPSLSRRKDSLRRMVKKLPLLELPAALRPKYQFGVLPPKFHFGIPMTQKKFYALKKQHNFEGFLEKVLYPVPGLENAPELSKTCTKLRKMIYDKLGIDVEPELEPVYYSLKGRGIILSFMTSYDGDFRFEIPSWEVSDRIKDLLELPKSLKWYIGREDNQWSAGRLEAEEVVDVTSL